MYMKAAWMPTSRKSKPMPEMKTVIVIAQGTRMPVNVFVSCGRIEANHIARTAVTRRYDGHRRKVPTALPPLPQPSLKNPVHLGVMQGEEGVVGRAGSVRERPQGHVVHPVVHHAMGSVAASAEAFESPKE